MLHYCSCRAAGMSNVFLVLVVRAATLGFCHTGLCTRLFCSQSDLVAVR